MPELPDLSNYIEALIPRIVGEPLMGIRISNPFILRSVDPGVEEVCGNRVENLSRLANASSYHWKANILLPFI